MNTAQRAQALAAAAAHFPILGKITADDLLEIIHLELGHREILDGFRPYSGHFSRAVAPAKILHIVSGNTPHAALQSLIRGLLMGSQNLVKIPSEGLPEAEQLFALLPPELQALAEIRRDLPPAWLKAAQAWIVFGSDETIAHFRKQAPSGVLFQAHGHRVSFGVVFDDPGFVSASLAAADVSRFDQKGCLSPHDFYVAGNARAYAERLAQEMQKYEERDPRGALTTLESAQISDMRANYRFRAASDSRVQLWESEGTTAWTVIYEEDPWFAASCLNRVVFVKPLPDGLMEAMGPAQPWLAAIGIWPATPANVEHLADLAPSRLCALGQMQAPPFSWHQEGKQTLAPFVRWVDFEPQIG